MYHLLYINCGCLSYFGRMCDKNYMWSSESEILILEVLERCVLHCGGEHGFVNVGHVSMW